MKHIALTPLQKRLIEPFFWLGDLTRQAAVAQLRESRTKLNAALGDLLELGWLESGQALASSGGRRPVVLRLGSRRGIVIGIDIDQTDVRIGVFTGALEMLGSRVLEFGAGGGPGRVLALISRGVDELLLEHNLADAQVLVVGLALPGPVERRTGTLVRPPASTMAGWEGFSTRDHFAERFDAPVDVDNDANAMAFGELWAIRRAEGFRHRPENLITLKVRVGIGAGVIAGGRLYRGDNGAAGEVGHVGVEADGLRCPCGYRGCLEQYAGAVAIVRAAEDAARRGLSSQLVERLSANGQLTLDDVVQAVRGGDELANGLVQQAGTRIGQVLALLVNVLNPARVLIGGTLGLSGPIMLASIRQGVYGRSLPLATRSLVVDYTRLGELSGVTGIAALALAEVISV